MILLKKIKNMFASPAVEDSRLEERYTVDVWYDRNTRLWTAQYKDDIGNQVGATGYGHDKKSAMVDLEYQNHDII